MPFEMPESYRAYCTDAAVRTAVDHILSSADTRRGLGLPADIDIVGTNFRLAPGICDDSERVQLSLSFWDHDDTDHTTGRNFGDDWPVQQIADGCAWTAKGLAPIRDNGTIDLDSLHKAAADALTAVRTHLRD